MARGYEVAKGQYLLVEDKEFEAIQIESTRTIDIDQFVPRNEIDERYIEFALLHRPRWSGRARCLCCHPRYYRQIGYGRTRAGRADTQGARHRTWSRGGEVYWDDPAVSL